MHTFNFMNTVKFDKGNIEVIETAEGFLKAKVSIARPGVFPYLENGKLVHEAKLPGDILSKSTLDSAKGAPVVGDLTTQDHPKDSNGYILVDSENYSQFVKGNISEPRIEGDKIVATETIYDSNLIAAIKKGDMREVSIGFTHTYDMVPGEYAGQKYDRAQKNIIINHVAHVDKGRAGDEIKIHVDRGIDMDKNIQGTVGAGGSTPNTDKKFSYRKFDGSTDISVSQEVHEELMLLRNNLKEFNAKIDGYEKEIEELKADSSDNEEIKSLKELNESLKETVDSWKSQFDALKNSIPEKAAELAKERSELVDFAKSAEISVDGLSNDEIKLQIIAKGLPFKEGVKVDSLNAETINARYDAACELLKEKANLSNPKPVQRDSNFTVDSSHIEEMRNKGLNMYGGK